MKIALFKSVRYPNGEGSPYVCQAHEDTKMNGYYARSSEVLEIHFPPRDEADFIASQLKSLDMQQAEIVTELNDKLSEISARRKELLAITHQPADDEKPF